jgi:hypothetical protein
MYEFNGWFVLKESVDEKPDRSRIEDLTHRLSGYRWNASRLDIVQLDRQFCLRMTGMMNRNRGESEELHALMDTIAQDLPGSYGLLYEWSDEPDLPSSTGDGAFQVHVLERGGVSRRMDPFLSPPPSVSEN